jgi:hypothetical protein
LSGTITSNGSAEISDEREFYSTYEDYSKVLRAWFVAYGVGAPVILATNDRLAAIVTASSATRCISALFLAGVSLQILLAAINKNAMWGCYYAARNPEKTNGKWRFRVAQWLSEQFWIDFVIDIATLISFGIATWHTFDIVFRNG